VFDGEIKRQLAMTTRRIDMVCAVYHYVSLCVQCYGSLEVLVVW